jgi:hypothetical protein
MGTTGEGNTGPAPENKNLGANEDLDRLDRLIGIIRGSVRILDSAVSVAYGCGECGLASRIERLAARKRQQLRELQASRQAAVARRAADVLQGVGDPPY